MSSRVVEIDGKRWLLGMTWHPYTSKPNTATIKQDAKENEAQWYAMRQGKQSLQVGYCNPAPGVSSPRGLSSLAATVADSHQQPWLGMYKLDDDLYWYVAVRTHHALIPQGDRVGTYEEIMVWKENDASLGGWSYIDGDINDLTDLIRSVPTKRTKVKSLSLSKKTWILLGIIPLLVTVALAGCALWWKQKNQKEESARQAREALLASLRASQGSAQQASGIASSQPSPGQFLSICQKSFESLPTVRYGWLLSGVSCSMTGMQLVWDWQEGATLSMRPEGDVSADGKKVMKSVPLRFTASPVKKLLPLAYAREALMSWAQEQRIALNVEQPGAALPLPGANSAITKSLQSQLNFSFAVPAKPFALNVNVPGARLTAVSTNPDGGWSIKGVLYGS